MSDGRRWFSGSPEYKILAKPKATAAPPDLCGPVVWDHELRCLVCSDCGEPVKPISEEGE